MKRRSLSTVVGAVALAVTLSGCHGGSAALDASIAAQQQTYPDIKAWAVKGVKCEHPDWNDPTSADYHAAIVHFQLFDSFEENIDLQRGGD
jgi:hypothetical protein